MTIATDTRDDMGTGFLGSLIRKYRKDSGRRLDDRLAFYGRMGLREAIEKAGMALAPNLRRHPHQRRIKLSVLTEVRDRLLCQEKALSGSKSFDEVNATVESCSVSGFGPVGVYDTALNIGAQLGLFPEKIYLHAGTRKGARVLGLTASKDFLSREDLPTELRDMEPYHIENFLCIYKDDFLNASAPGQAVGDGCSSPGPRRRAGCAT
jgi:hypothetical protein